jgi:integrase/recombinase XerD
MSRAFLRYARCRGDLTRDLVAAVPVVANWSMPSTPRAIPAASVRQLLASIDRQTARGRRDYAIVLLLARLGLRASEVACLELDDLNWESGQITVRGKRGTRATLPLPVDVGAAIAAYLQHGRPPSTCRRVCARLWLCRPECDRLRRARRPCASRRQCPDQGRAPIPPCLATQMLRGGASLTEIGEILRHRSAEHG